MKTYCFTLKVQSAFGTPLVGDSLFGQLCWAVVHQFGESRLTELLQGYNQQQPFMVVSDALPSGYLPLPTVPSKLWQTELKEDRKKLKKLSWLPLTEIQNKKVNQWQEIAFKHQKQLDDDNTTILEKKTQDQLHNAIDRSTGTTGTSDAFAPYSSSKTWYGANTLLDIYICLDENRIQVDQVKILLNNIGMFGFGRDASTGLGKFSIESVEVLDYHNTEANAYLTLANCAPQNLSLAKEHCYYQITTRFGRHGDINALSSNPFKKPIILAKAGAIFTPNTWQDRQFLGNGLTGVSYVQSQAVHQGYAPVIPVYVDFKE
ncbi:CRISPR-associated protein Csm4 [Pasteurellaceae bacterium LFhippo2]|nr:CRISPR-associated protein Csm4 [Pasteurellaceae bacterium LFhippo2]